MIALKNNFIMAPVKTGYSNRSGVVTDKHIKFYQARSKYIGAVIPEPFYIDKGLREIPTQMGIDNDDKIDGLLKLTTVIHQFNTKVIAHLNHPGRMANPKIPENYFWSSTDKACENGGASPKKMDKNDIQHAINLFTNATKRAEKSGFDIIELQFGHGYLVAQFISPKVNNRTDEYGGNFENRIKFPLQILEAVKSATNLPIIIRISGDEMLTDGIKIDEMIKFSKILKEKGVEAIHVSAGTVCNTPPWYFQHMFVPKSKTWEFAKKIKQEVGIPTIFVGQINTEEDINNLFNNFKADYIALGRALIADPDFVGKYTKQINGTIRPCLACSDGCLGGVKSGHGLGCLVNPLVGSENEKLEKASVKQNIAVIGGGLSGSEAALTLHKRGHKVTLFEKDKIGGQFRLAYLPPKKDSLKKLIDYYENILSENNINIINIEATANDLKDFDRLILATGSIPAYPPIKNLKEYFWAEILKDKNLPENKTILVIGGGLIGTEIAHKLVQKNNKVILVEMLDEIARGMEMIEKTLTLKNLQASENIKIYTKTKVTEIDDNKVFVDTENGQEILTGVDIVVLSTGMKSFNPLEKELKNKIPTYVIGDAKKVGKAQDAIKDAYETVKNI
ncbi:MAG: NAD(P)/FAD-dependent oxidoreductase [Bacteroidota bacterium]